MTWQNQGIGHHSVAVSEGRGMLHDTGELMPSPKRHRYRPPGTPHDIRLDDLLAYCHRRVEDSHNDLFRKAGEAEPIIHFAGKLDLLRRPCVSVIGARAVSPEGKARAARIARELAKADIVVVSGLAKGVDQAAHQASIDSGGRTVAVIGTPLDKAYPAENGELQEAIWRDHLLISQFRPGQRTFPSDFPKRNRLMAAITDASIIVEASDTSGTLHQAAECARLGRWLFIMRSVVENPKLTWPKKFIGLPKVAVLTDPTDVIARVSR